MKLWRWCLSDYTGPSSVQETGSQPDLRVAMVVFSGNKSIHFWFSVKGQKAEYVEDFFNLAHCLGADPVMWNTWQFARMPNVKRNDHKVRDVEQKVHFIAKPED